MEEDDGDAAEIMYSVLGKEWVKKRRIKCGGMHVHMSVGFVWLLFFKIIRHYASTKVLFGEVIVKQERK